MSLLAPVDAALLIALEAGAPVYAHPSCFRNTPVRPRPPATTAAPASEEAPPAGAKKEPLAALLADLPDEDFGNVH